LFNHMYSNGDYPFKFGKHMGTDPAGNKYFENLVDYPYGQHRWVEPSDLDNFDSSQVPPEWHGWMHHMSDAPGDGQLDGGENRHVLQTLVPKHAHVGAPTAIVGLQNPVEHWRTDMHNQSQVRERGWRVGNTVTGFPGGADGTAYYTQPGSRYNNKEGGRFGRDRTNYNGSVSYVNHEKNKTPETIKKVHDYQFQKK